MLFAVLCAVVFFAYRWVHPSEAARFAWGHKHQILAHKASWYRALNASIDGSPNYGEFAMRGHAPYSDGTSSC